MLYPDQPVVPTPVRFPKYFELARQRRTNYFRSFGCKAGRVMSFYSEPKFDYWALLETNPAVIAVCEEPKIIELKSGNKTKKHIIDIWVRYKGGLEEYVEVKRDSGLVEGANGKLAPRGWEKMLDWAHFYKQSCRFVTEKEIYQNMLRVQNARRIVVFAAQAYELRQHPILSDILNIVENKGPSKIANLEYSIEHQRPEKVRVAIALLLIMGKLTADLNKHVFDRNMMVYAYHE